MLGIWSQYNEVYLVVAGAAMLVAFGLPLLFVPLTWARVFRWQLPESGQLVTFLGRSMGVFVSIIAIFAFKASQNPPVQPFFFNLMLWIFAAMLILHVYGAIRKSQPITETFEIILWVVLSLVTLGFYPI